MVSGSERETIALRLSQLGFSVPLGTHRCPHMFGALLPEHYTGNLVSELSSRNIYISQRGNALRFAAHLHINKADVVRLIDALEELTQ